MRAKATRMHPRVIALVLALVCAFALPAAAASSGPSPTAARAAALYDPGSGAFLYTHGADRRLPVASLQKIMTAYLALQAPGDTPVRAGRDVLAMPQTDAGVVPGRTYRLGDLLPVMIVRSANDVAVAVADGLAGSVPAFARRMNRAAAAAGLRDTHYVNPSGLDAPGQYSSARDVAVLAGLAMRLPAFRALVRRRRAGLPGGTTFSDLNPFLAAYPGADGIKTGYTRQAGFCLAASATRAGRRLIAVVLHEPGWGRAVADASALLDWGFAQKPPARVASARQAAAVRARLDPRSRRSRPPVASLRPDPPAAPRPEPLPWVPIALSVSALGVFGGLTLRRRKG